MNCMEAQALVEDALDEALTGNRRRALDLHLSRCDACRAFFAAEKEEHRRWFGAMNDPAVCRRLSEGLAEEFLASLAHGKAAPQKRWAVVGMFRRIAAVLAAMLLFAGLSYAAVVAVDGLRDDDAAQKTTPEGLQETAESPVSTSASEDEHVADAVLLAEPLSGGETSLATESYNQQSGGAIMNKSKAAAAALSVAMAAAPLSAADDDSYRYIISTPYPEANVYPSAVSAPSSIDAGAYRVAGVAKELEARFRSCSRSVVIALNAMEFKTFIITFR